MHQLHRRPTPGDLRRLRRVGMERGTEMTKKGGDGYDPEHAREDEKTRQDMERERKSGQSGDKKGGGGR